jgi:hypothetical protein
MLSNDKIRRTVEQVLRERHVKNFKLASRENSGKDIVVESPRSKLILEVKHIRPASIDEVLGALAVWVLKAHKNISKNDRIPLLILERLGDKTRRAVRQFMFDHARNCSWGLIDQSGAAQFVVQALNLDVDQPGQNASPPWSRQRPTRLFSDLNQWMLKILLLADAPPSLWSGPRQSVTTPTELHRVAHVSVEKAHQFVRAFEQIGMIRQSRHGLSVVRKKALIDMWFHDERSRCSRRMPVRWIFGEPKSLEQVFSKKDAPSDFAICGFEACRYLGVLHAPVANREVYFFGDPEVGLAAWDLEACDDRDAHFYFLKARSTQSILRGRLVKSNLPVVDVLQAALDVCDQAARGMEQAQYIINHILGWRDDE